MQDLGETGSASAAATSAHCRTIEKGAGAYCVPGRFSIIRTLRSSAASTEFLAVDHETPDDSNPSGKPVRLTVLDSDARGSRPDVDLFLLEARTAATLHHPNISETLGACFTEGAHASFAEYKPDCESLADLLDRRGWLEFSEALAITSQLALALDNAHQCGVLHLNVHPENILIDKTGAAVLSGFGLACDPELEWARLRRSQRQHPSYRSPEQGLGLATDRRSDLYSLGIVIFEMLTDRAPFHADDPDTIKQRQMSQPACSLRLLRPELPDHLTAAVAKLLEKNPEERYQTASELLKALVAAPPESAGCSSVESEQVQLPDELESPVPDQPLLALAGLVAEQPPDAQRVDCTDPDWGEALATESTEPKPKAVQPEAPVVDTSEALSPTGVSPGAKQPYEAPSIRIIPPKVERRSTPIQLASMRPAPSLTGTYLDGNKSPFWSQGWFLLAVVVLTALISFVALGVAQRPEDEGGHAAAPVQNSTTDRPGSPGPADSPTSESVPTQTSSSPPREQETSKPAAPRRSSGDQVRSSRSSQTGTKRSRGRSSPRRVREQRPWLFR